MDDDPTTIIEDLDPDPQAGGARPKPKIQNPKFGEVLIGVALVLGVVLWASGQSWQQASEEQARGQATATAVIADAEKYYQQGWQFIGEKKNNMAVAQFGEVIALRPDYPEGYYSRGWARLNIDGAWGDHMEADAKRALEDFGQAIELRPTYAEAYNGQGLAYVALQQYDKAIEEFGRAVKLRPGFSEAYFNRGIIYLHLNRDMDAVTDFTSAIKYGAGKYEAAAYSQRAQAYQFLGVDVKALEDYEQAIAVNPNEPWYYEQRARLYESRSDYDSAIEQYTRLIKVDKSKAQYYEQRSYLYEAKGDYDSAIKDLDLAQTYLAYGQYVGRDELKDDSSWLDASKGFLYIKKGDYTEAIHQLNVATWHGLKEASVYVGLGRAYAAQAEVAQASGNAGEVGGHVGRALANFDMALQAAPNNPDAYAYSSLAYAVQGKYARALAQLNKAEAWGESKEVLALLRGQVYLMEGNSVNARAEFEAVPALTKDHWMLSEAREGLRMLEEQK